MDNATRKFLLQRHKQSGFPGSILDVFQAYNQGIDIIGQFEQQNNIQVAQTPQQQQQGLRPAHQAGNISQSMIFPNVPPNTPFNTVGMKAPINIEKYDEQGHLVKSYENVPPGVQNLPTGPQRGTVIETPANMQAGGDYNMARAKELGYKPDAAGHYPSVDHETGMLLKSKVHPTAKLEFMSQMLSPERKMIANPTGYFGENQLQYVPRKMQSGGVQDNTRVSMPTLPTTIPLDTSALQPPPDQGTIRQAGRAAPPNAMAFMPPGLQYNQMAAGKYIEENPLSNPVSLTAMGAFEALSPLAFGASAPTRSRQAINLSKDVMPESMQITKLQNQATRAIRGMRQADLDLIGDANRALRRGAAEHNLFNRRTVDRASDLFYEAARERATFNKNKNTLLRNIQNLYGTPSVGGRTLRPGEAPNRYTLSALDDLTDRFTNNTMSGLNLNQAGGVYQSAGPKEEGPRKVLTMGMPGKVDVIGEMAGNEPAKFADLAGTDFNLEWNNSPMAQQMLTESYMKSNRGERDKGTVLSALDVIGAGDAFNRYVSQKYAKETTDERNQNLLSASYLPSSDVGEFANQYGDNYRSTIRAFFSPGRNITVYNPNYSGQLTDKLLGTGVHERSHASDRSSFPLADFNMMQSFRSSDEEGEVVQKTSDRYREYVQEPTETRARIMDMRRGLYNQGVDVFNSPVTREQFDDYLKGNSEYNSPFGELNTGYSKDDIFKMLNAIAYEGDNNLPQNVAKRGGKRPMRKYFKLRK
jgi:uncharacterized membrane protein (UPF0127 family)|tara:strand:- start:3483 stop:5747 length:2265 start_codon:yes stop_codon:yes gene_type:complete